MNRENIYHEIEDYKEGNEEDGDDEQAFNDPFSALISWVYGCVNQLLCWSCCGI